VVDHSGAEPGRPAAALIDSATVFTGAVVSGFRGRLRAIALITRRDPRLLRAAAGLGRELLGGRG
jgi:hypothetical protein